MKHRARHIRGFAQIFGFYHLLDGAGQARLKWRPAMSSYQKKTSISPGKTGAWRHFSMGPSFGWAAVGEGFSGRLDRPFFHFGAVVHKDIPIPVMHRFLPESRRNSLLSLWIELGIGTRAGPFWHRVQPARLCFRCSLWEFSAQAASIAKQVLSKCGRTLRSRPSEFSTGFT